MRGGCDGRGRTSTTDLFEIVRTTRSMRRLKPDPVPDALIRKVLEAGVCAPSGGNMQGWRFLVVRDATIKQTVGAYYKRAWNEVVGPRYATSEPAPGMDQPRIQAAARRGGASGRAHPRGARLDRSLPARRHADPRRGLFDLPGRAKHAPGGAGPRPGGDPDDDPFVVREGSGSCSRPAEDWHSYAILPVGYPMGRFGPVRRVALADVVFEDRWGQAYRDR